MLNSDTPVAVTPTRQVFFEPTDPGATLEVSQTSDAVGNEQTSPKPTTTEKERTTRAISRTRSDNDLESRDSPDSDFLRQTSPTDLNPRKRTRQESQLEAENVRRSSNGSEIPAFVRKSSESTGSLAGHGSLRASSQLTISKSEPSFLNIEPYSEIVRVISDFVFHHLVVENLENLELEAKLGRIIDKSTNERLQMHILTEAVLETGEPSQLPFRFESDMSSQQHKQFNQTLNKAFESAQPKTNPTRIPMSYKHTRETDKIYEGNGRKLRVTTDQKTQRVLATVTKERVADLNILSPRTPFDWRISISTETPVNGPPPSATPKVVRHKDRVSYIHQYYQMDLTQVGTGKELKHELEVEFNQIEELKKQGESAVAGRPNKFEEMITGFVNSVRLLCRPPV